MVLMLNAQTNIYILSSILLELISTSHLLSLFPSNCCSEKQKYKTTTIFLNKPKPTYTFYSS